jgi:hypothetical protein
MIWLQPWAAWLLAGLPIIVLLYLLKVRRRPATVSTLIFWQRLFEEHRRRALFQKLRHLLSMLLHLLIFALLIAALARPTLDRFVRDGASTVLVVDLRARMQALEPDGSTRWHKAQRIARTLIGDAHPSRQFAIVAAGPRAAVALPFTGRERPLREALASLSPTDGGGELAPALRLAEDLAATRRGSRRIVLLTDHPPSPAHKVGSGIEVRPVGTALDNVGILRFASRPLPASPQTSEVYLEVRNFSATSLSTQIELHYDERLLDVKPITIPAERSITLFFPSVPRPSATARGWLTAKLAHQDALALDNLARTILPPPRPARVLLVSPGNAFIERALAADPATSFELLEPAAATPPIVATFDVVIYDGAHPEGAAPTNALYLGKTPLDAASEPIVAPVLTEIDASHPILRKVSFDAATILRARALTLPEPADDWTYAAPLRSFDHPLLIAGEQRRPPHRRIAALGLDLAATDLPLRVAFPLFISNAVHWLAGSPIEGPPTLRAGESLALDPGQRIATEPAPARSFQPMQNGFYELAQQGRSTWIAVNTFDAAESNLRPAPGSAPPSHQTPAFSNAAAALSGWPLWRWLALAALALFTLEWSLFHRRRTE